MENALGWLVENVKKNWAASLEEKSTLNFLLASDKVDDLV